MKLKIILLILIGLVGIIWWCDNYYRARETYVSSCPMLPKLYKQVMQERNVTHNYYMPCSYNSCEKDILAFENHITGKKIFLIDGCDWIASKLALWKLLKDEYNSMASEYMPTTFLLKSDMEDFPSHFDANKKINPNQMYVLKNYAQRQEGIKLTKDIDTILNGINNGWHLVQDYIYNPFIIDKRKINLRYYLLIVCRLGKIEGYIHMDGFVYYTPKYYDPNVMDFDSHITTGYIDRQVYKNNPLTLQDFRDHLDAKSPGQSKIWNYNAENLMNKVMKAISKKICSNKKLNNHVRFQLFGADLAPDANLGVKLMEINKGPDLDAKDERDKQVKLNVQRDIFTIVDPEQGLSSERGTKFVKIF
jgi:hypothetical protein